MSGVDICKQVRAAQIHTPILVLSAIGEEVDKVLLLESGTDDYVTKPLLDAGNAWLAFARCCGVRHPIRTRCCDSPTWRSTLNGVRC